MDSRKSAECMVLNAKSYFCCGLLLLGGLALATNVRAGLFDFLRPKSEKASNTVARGQAPDPRYNAPFPTPNGWQPPAGGNPAPFAQGDPYAESGWGYDSSPCYNCGEMDRGQGWVQFWRKKTHQTYYPRSAPYCQPEWGWHQSCWRRMRENYNCQRPDYHASTPQPRLAMPLPAPVVPPSNPAPGPQSRAYPPSRAIGYSRGDAAAMQRAAGSAGPRESSYNGRNESLPAEAESAEWADVEGTGTGPQMDAIPAEAGRSGYYTSPRR